MASKTPDPALLADASALQIETARAILAWIVENDLPIGFHLREHQLCDVLKLSRSPIRKAFTVLEAYGIVGREPERGCFLAVPGHEIAGREPLLPSSPSDELYRVVAAAWFNGEIDKVASTAELRRRFGPEVGRVLERLADDGIILRQAGKGWRLGANLASEEAFLENYEFRMTVEPAAILLPSFSLDRPLAALVRRRHEEILAPDSRITVKEMVDADLAFHRLIAISCGNQFFEQAILRNNSLRRLTEMLTTPESTRLRISSAEHMAILDAIERGKMEVAAALMADHLTVSRKYSPEFIEESRNQEGAA